MEPVQITVNGQVRTAEAAGPHLNLLTWLRDHGLTGAKEGCAEGECGACAVMVARADDMAPDRTRWTAINACLLPALAFDGQEVITAEGLGTAPGACQSEDLHPVQREMAQRGGSQCGYCTPGFICSMAAEYYRPDRTAQTGPTPTGPTPTDDSTSDDSTSDDNTSELTTCGANGFDLHALSGNLCRCTGYRPIRDAAYALDDAPPDDPLARRRMDPPPSPRTTTVRNNGARFIRPATLTDLLDHYHQHPEAALLAGATDLGVDINLRHARPPLVLAVDHLPELRTLRSTEHHIEIGAALTLSELERTVAKQVPILAGLLPQFASPLIRNTASLGGNLATASPIGDAAPALLALDATLILISRHGEREVPLADFFTGYRTTAREPGELIHTVRIPRPLAPMSVFHKVAKRRFDDISSVAMAIAMWVDGNDGGAANDDGGRPGGGTVTQVRIGLGGVAATPIRATATEAALTGQRWTETTARQAAAILATEGTPMDDHRASADYRAAMLEQSLLRFFAQTNSQVRL